MYAPKKHLIIALLWIIASGCSRSSNVSHSRLLICRTMAGSTGSLFMCLVMVLDETCRTDRTSINIEVMSCHSLLRRNHLPVSISLELPFGINSTRFDVHQADDVGQLRLTARVHLYRHQNLVDYHLVQSFR